MITDENRKMLTNTLYILSCENIIDELVIDERWKIVSTLTDEQLLFIDTLFLDKDWTGYDISEIIKNNRERFNKLWNINNINNNTLT